MAVLSLTKHEMYPAQLLAKKLNNRACSLIGTRKKGSFNESIALLTKALKLTVRDISENFNKVACDCEFCSLDACLTMEEEEQQQQQQQQRDNSTSTIMETDDSVVGGDNYWRRNSQEHNRNHCNTVLSDTGGGTTHLDKQQQQQQQQQQHYSSSSDDGGFVFRRLLCINNHSIEEHHYMGFTLSVVILLNLALVHHMKAIIEDDETTSLTGFVLAMKLYELSYDEHIKQQLAYNNNNKNSSSSSNNINDKHCSPNFRLTVIILNNLGEIHRVLGDQKKHMMCLNHLLSVIMYLVDSSNLVHVLDSTEFDGMIRNIVVDKIPAPAA